MPEELTVKKGVIIMGKTNLYWTISEEIRKKLVEDLKVDYATVVFKDSDGKVKRNRYERPGLNDGIPSNDTEELSAVGNYERLSRYWYNSRPSVQKRYFTRIYLVEIDNLIYARFIVSASMLASELPENTLKTLDQIMGSYADRGKVFVAI